MTKPVVAAVFAMIVGACHPGTGGGGGGDAVDAPAGPELDAAVEPEVDYYTVTATANSLLVAADAAGAPLVANRVAAAEWEHFEVIEHADGTIALRARANGRFVVPDDATRLVATSPDDVAAAAFDKLAQADGTFALRARANGQFVSADLDAGAVLQANRAAVGGAWETFRFDRVTSRFGPNVLVFDPSMSRDLMQRRLDAVFARQEENQFGTERFAVLFAPGTYDLDVNVGFYTEIAGLGASPDDVTIRGALHAEADWFDGNATQNFWRAVGNLAVEPAGGTARWAVSQASPLRRVHVRGNLALDDGGWSSGGFLADARIDGDVDSGSQQQWLSRSSTWGGWRGSNWNMVFAGTSAVPAGAWPNPPFTVIDRVPVVREKPFLFVDGAGAYQVFVPTLRTDTTGTSWANGPAVGATLALDRFHIARADVDTAATLNAALAAGQHLLFTPGVYHLDDTLRVTTAGTVVLGLGLATLVADAGVIAMEVADVDGAVIAGLLFDAGPTESPVLLRVGPPGSAAAHAANPTSLHDVFFRVGGAAVGRAAVSLEINSDHVIADHLWIWRGDHSFGVGWTVNTTRNGVIVNGDDVTMYGLFVEHYHRVQTQWNGERGRVYFYQSEIPYDVPSQELWMNGGRNGFASYAVGAAVTRHEAWGLGVYCFFNDNPSVALSSAITAPDAPGVRFHHVVTVSLGGRGEITHAVNDRGAAARAGATVAHLAEYP